MGREIHQDTGKLPYILLVEDNQDDYEAIARGFKKSDFFIPIQWCRNGHDALDYLKNKGAYAQKKDVHLPDLILLDLNMPGIDGKCVLKAIKDDDDLKKIPVIILTTSLDRKDIDQCYSMGARTYIQKPVNFAGLKEVVCIIKKYWFDVAAVQETL